MGGRGGDSLVYPTAQCARYLVLREAATDKQPAGFVVLTMQPNAMVAPYHNRMPVMLDPASTGAFIGGTVDEAAGMLKAYPAGTMHAHRVSTAMNKSGYDGPDCIAAI